MTLGRGQKVKYYLQFLYQTLCVFSQIKDRKYIEHNFHSVARVMPRVGTFRLLGAVKNFSVVICDGAPSTARSSVYFIFCPFSLVLNIFSRWR